jgi:cytochrome c oxidase subunit 3
MINIRNNQQHSFHLVDPSPWPIIAATGAFMLTFGGVLFMHGYLGGAFLLRFGFFMILFMMFVWWRDIVREGTLEGQHTDSVQAGLKMGMLLFIASEVMFFSGFFWAFFHSSFNPWSRLASRISYHFRPMESSTIKYFFIIIFWGISNMVSSCDCIR